MKNGTHEQYNIKGFLQMAKMVAIDYCDYCPHLSDKESNKYQKCCDKMGHRIVENDGYFCDLSHPIPDWCPLFDEIPYIDSRDTFFS